MDDAKKNTTTDIRPKLFEPGRYYGCPADLMADPNVRASAKLVWMALAGHLGPHGTAVWPSIPRLQALTGQSRMTVIRDLRSLEGLGYVDAERTPGKVTRYRIRQPEAGLFSGTGTKMGRVPKRDGTGPKMGRDPSQSETRSTQTTTQGTNPPLPPRVAGGGEEEPSGEQPNGKEPVAAEEAAGRDAGPWPQSPAETAAQAIERAEAAYRDVFGPDAGLTSRERRRIERGWTRGDRWWLARIDAEAVRAGRAKAAAKEGREFGLGWVQKAIAEQAATEQAKAKATVIRKRAAEEAARQAEAKQDVAAAQAEQADAERTHFDGLDEDVRQRFMAAARQANRYIRRPDVLEQWAARQAWVALREEVTT